ncbi:MAG TPA: LysR family transcriptional regulator [Candidatus Avoscillospira stercoripullorum]|uniref:LysR family transcriptional regulator n=1 Tax=Candidatus Avoscillospira stercoripullorum TaxID=2840709 RepID=A0A9D1A6M2_9FIRM|nr:LysR family transcriptional regulator [Candidatus Avoscillospira stercoripullorum]
MNTQHLQYIVEIERTRSISQAAKNLYLSQPNLSRVLHELEEQLGFAIFERTSRGVMPTDRGALFLQYARRILMEMESIEALGRFDPAKNRLRICFPRSGRYLDVAARFLAESYPGAYTWISPALPEDLARWELVQRDCADNGVYYRDALIYRRSYTFTEMERQLLRRILTQMKEEARLLKNPAED